MQSEQKEPKPNKNFNTPLFRFQFILLAILLILLSIALIYQGIKLKIDLNDFESSTTKTTAGKVNNDLKIEFEVNGNKYLMREGIEKANLSKSDIGKDFEVIYSENNPSFNYHKSSLNDWKICFFIGLFLFVIGVMISLVLYFNRTNKLKT